MEPALHLAVNWLTQEHRLFWFDWSYLKILGFVGQAIFGTRFLMQWIASERAGRSVVPVNFWYWSIAGSLILVVYWVLEREPVGLLANLPNVFVYWRNIQLIKKNQPPLTTPPQGSGRP